MIEVDGSLHSGSGTLLRYAVVLSSLTGESLHVFRIRAKRDKPGLRPQHLQSIRACASICSGRLEGDDPGSQEIFYTPGNQLDGGSFHWDIGTAGSTTMLAFSVLPLAIFAKRQCHFTLIGGLFQDFAPSAFHMRHVLFPIIGRMGADIRMDIVRPGYVPEGKGHLEIDVKPLVSPLGPLHILRQGNIRKIRGTSLASHLERENVSMRMADRCRELLRMHGYQADIQIMNDTTAHQRGAALMLAAATDSGCIIGADRAGKRGRRSEAIAEFVVTSLMQDLKTGATTDRHLADQLILYAALAEGRTEYVVPFISDHVESNLWLVGKILGAGTSVDGNTLRIDGIGYFR